MLRPFTVMQLGVLLLIGSCARSLTMEQQVVGAWSWTYIEGVGRIILAPDHTVRTGFPPDDKDGRKISDAEFDIVQAGTWRVEGDILITEMDNKPLIEMLQRLSPNDVPPLEKETNRRRIVSIDDKKMVFDDGYFLTRVHR
jgi:hypothetical protein